MLAFVALVPDALELIEVVLDQTIQRGGLGIPGPIDSLGQALHIGSNCPATPAANKMLNLRGTNEVHRDYDWIPFYLCPCGDVIFPTIACLSTNLTTWK